MNQFRETLSSSEPGSEPSGSLDPGLQSLADLAGQMGNTPKLASSEVSSTKDEKNEVARNNRIVGEKALQSYNDDLLRRQLVVERALNSSFTPMADLIAMMESGKEESSAQTVTYNGHDITIFNTGNLQFRYLQHSIEYSGGDGHPLVDRPEL